MINQWHKSSISKEDLQLLPSEVFNGRIYTILSPSEARRAVNALLKEPILGFDTETKPSLKRGEVHHICLVQISTPNECFLFRTMNIAIMQELKVLFESNDVLKIGLSLKDDFRGIHQIMDFEPTNFIDLQTYVKQYGIIDNGLSRIYAILFNKRISKSQRMSNWENGILTDQQKMYAALDAWATLRIYLELEQFKNT